MAIRPVDLQLAYMAAPQNAAVLNAAQEAPAAAQAAAASQFAAELAERQEHVDGASKSAGTKIRPRDERDPSDSYERDPDRDEEENAATARSSATVSSSNHDPAPGPVPDHFIDVTV